MIGGGPAPLIVWALASLLALAPSVTHARRAGMAHGVWTVALLAPALLIHQPILGALALASSTGLHAATVLRISRTSAVSLGVAAALQIVVAASLWVDAPEVGFLASLGSIALSAGAAPLHVGVAGLATQSPAAQTRAFATVLAMVWIHLRDLDHLPLAYTLAPAIVRIGAVMTLLPALTALVARDVRDLYRTTVVTHAGMLVMAVGAAGRGHYAAALFAALTMGLAMGGLGVTVVALEARAGLVSLHELGGRVRPFPAMAASFAVFGAAGVGMPGTAGFIADDLLLHAVWEESAVGAAALILASATLAVGTLRGYARIFLGPPARSVAPDLLPRERFSLAALWAVLVVLGVAPQLFVSPASAVLGAVPVIVGAEAALPAVARDAAP
jgi:NADH:ubiquinone oxidoreductase subunit 4 (subunit M)